MTLVNARAAFETAISTAVTTADATVSVVFDNMPFTTPGKTKKYVLVSINFDQSTIQAHGPAQSYYAGTVQCGVFTPRNKGSVDSVAIAESVIDGLTSVNKPGHASLFFRRIVNQSLPVTLIINNWHYWLNV